MLADASTEIPKWIIDLANGNLSLGAAIVFIFWYWILPILKTVSERHLTFLDNIEKTQEKIEQSISSGPQLHQITHLKIDAVHNDVKKLRPRPDSDLKDVK